MTRRRLPDPSSAAARRVIRNAGADAYRHPAARANPALAAWLDQAHAAAADHDRARARRTRALRVAGWALVVYLTALVTVIALVVTGWRP